MNVVRNVLEFYKNARKITNTTNITSKLRFSIHHHDGDALYCEFPVIVFGVCSSFSIHQIVLVELIAWTRVLLQSNCLRSSTFASVSHILN